MDVDSLMCLSSDEKNDFEMLRLKNAKKKNFSDIFKTLEESIDSVVHDGSDDGILPNSDRIPNSLESSNSSASGLGDLIDIVTSRIGELKNTSDRKKSNHLEHKPSDDVFNLIMKPDTDQPISENLKKYGNPETNNEICSRYPELFEIFVEESKTQFSNLSEKSETEVWDSKNVGKPFSYEAPEKFKGNSYGSFPDFQRSKVNLEDAEVSSDKTSSIPNEIFLQKSSGDIREDILPEKLQSKELRSPASNFRTPIQKFSLPNNLANSKSFKKPEINPRSYDGWKIENQSSSIINRVPSSLENVPPLSSILSPRTESSKTSLNSWRTLRDSPRTNDENNFPGASFNSRSSHELETDSKRIKIGIKKGKLKTGDRNKMKKKRKLTLDVEKIHEDIQLKKSRVLVIKSDTKITNENLKGGIDNERDKKQNSILRKILDILLEVELNLFSNRKLAESIKERYQNLSILQSVVSFDVIESLNKGISRCAMSIQNWENNREVIIGVEELLLDSVLRLKVAVKEERDYLKQQEYYCCKQFSELAKNNRKTINLKKTTIHTLMGNDLSILLTQKDKIEELISYIISLITRMLPKKYDEKKELKNFRKKNLIDHVKSEEEPQTQLKIFVQPKEIPNSLSKEENKRQVGKIFKNAKEITESKPRVNPTFVKQNTEPLKMLKKNISNDKFTRSSTLVVNGSNKDSKQVSNHVMKLTNKGRCPSMTQPIWKPAGNAKPKILVQPILRQKTRTNLSSFEKNKEKQAEGLIRNQQSSRNISSKESSIQNSKSHIQKSSINCRSSDLPKKSGSNQKKETEEKSKSEAGNSNLNLNPKILKTKRKSKQPEAIKMLKEIIKSTSEEGNLKRETPLNGLETCDCVEEISVRYLQSKNKIESARSGFASTSMIKKEHLNNPEKIQFKSENPLKSTVESKSKTKWNSRKSKTHLEEYKNRMLKTSNARIPNSGSKTYLSKSGVIDSRSKTIIKDNKLKDNESKKVFLHSSKSSNLRSGSETKFPKTYLRKNSSNSSYLQSYIKLNSRQNLASNNSLKLAKERTEVKREKSENISDTLTEKEAKPQIEEIKIEDKKKNEEVVGSSKELIDFNLESEEISHSLKASNSCESLVKISSSKYCQASFEPSICSKISGDLYSEDSNEVQKSSEDFNAKKKKFVNKHTSSLLTLKDILKNHGVDADLVDEAERKLRSKQKGSKSIFYDNGDGNLLAVCSSKTLYEKLASLSDTSFEELEIKDAMNQCSLESSDQEIQVSESQEYFQSSETSLSSQSIKKSTNFYSRFFLTNKKDADQKVSNFSQTMFSSRKSEESQTHFFKNVQTETEKTDLEKLSYTDVEVSCSLENSILSRKEASTEISFKTSCCEIDTQTKFNSEKDTITDFGWENQEIEDSNKNGMESEFVTRDSEDIFIDDLVKKEIVLQNNEEFRKDIEDTYKINEDISTVDSSLTEEIEEKKDEIKFHNCEEDSGIESENFARVSEDIFIDNSIKKEIELQNNEKKFGKDIEDICKIAEDISTVDSSLTEETVEKKDEVNFHNCEEDSGIESENVARVSEDIFIDDPVKKKIELHNNEKEFGKDIEDISTVDSLLREETEEKKDEAKLKNFEENSAKDSVIESETSSDQYIGGFNEFSLRNSLKKSEIKTLVDHTSETNSQIKLISRLEVTPSFFVFYNNKMPTAKSSKAKMETERSKNYKQEQFSKSYKKISQIKRERGKTFKECNNCGEKCGDSLNLSVKNQDFSSLESISSDNNSSIVKYENRPENLAVETLKLATERARNLYEDILLRKKSLSPRPAGNPPEAKFFRGKMNQALEEATKLEEDNFDLKHSKRKEEAEDTKTDLHLTTEENLIDKENISSENKLLESEDFSQENSNFLINNISNFKSKTLKTTLQNLQNRESYLTVVPEARELMENVEKNIEENDNKAFNFEKRIEEKSPIGNNFSGSYLLTVVYITGAIFSVIFWCFYSFIYEA